MDNYTELQLNGLESDSHILLTALSKSDKWVSNYLKYEDRDVLIRKIKNYRSEVEIVKNNIHIKPVFALFGISQVGKSYLVENILSSENSSLKVKLHQGEIDFLKEINPQGSGAESTGVVTRFTVDQIASPRAEYFTKIKLFEPKDIVAVIADAFFSNISRMDNYPTKSEIQQHVSDLTKKYSGSSTKQISFTENDIWYLRRYFREKFNKFSYAVNEIEASGFWMEVGLIIENVPYNEWRSIFKILWKQNNQLTELFDRLINGLAKLKFDHSVFVTDDAVLRDQGAILDVQRLQSLIDVSSSIGVCLSDGNIEEIEISLLSALTAELTLQVSYDLTHSKPFLATTDLLDFPGARSPENFLIENLNSEAVVKMFLRGKISYLFNKYNSEFEISNLLFCMKDEKIEVNEVADILNGWIENNLGQTPEARENTMGQIRQVPLFVVFTFFNRQLEFNMVNDDRDVSYKWDNRFNRFFEDQITFKYAWHINWTTSNPNFGNFYLLRDFKFSEDTFISELGKEVAIRPERENYMNRLRDSFVNHQFVTRHFDNPEKAWQNAATAGCDGSQYIIDSLSLSAGNSSKIRNLKGRLEYILTDVIGRFSGYFVSENLQEKRDQAFRESNSIQFEFMRLFDRKEFHFHEFIGRICLNDIEVYNSLHFLYSTSKSKVESTSFALFRSMFPDVNESLSIHENLKLIAGSLLLDSTEQAEMYLAEKGWRLEEVFENRVLTSASILVDSILNMWKGKMELDKFNDLFKLGLEQKRLSKFMQEFTVTFDSLRVRDELISIFENKTKLLYIPQDTEEHLASLITFYINDFVANFGFNFMREDKKLNLLELGRYYKIDVDGLNSANSSDDENSLKKVYDYSDSVSGFPAPLISNASQFFTKMKLAMISNCGFANYDVKANNELKHIIDSVIELEVSLSK